MNSVARGSRPRDRDRHRDKSAHRGNQVEGVIGRRRRGPRRRHVHLVGREVRLAEPQGGDTQPHRRPRAQLRALGRDANDGGNRQGGDAERCHEHELAQDQSPDARQHERGPGNRRPRSAWLSSPRARGGRLRSGLPVQMSASLSPVSSARMLDAAEGKNP